jgi:TonB-dependent receptor
MRLYLFILFILTSFITNAQIIKGSIKDSLTNEPIVGATVLVRNEQRGAITDLDGKFEIGDLVNETYSLEVRYSGYNNKIILVNTKIDTLLSLTISQITTNIEEVKVFAKANRESTTELVNLQRNSAVVMDGISSEAFKRTPDSKASDVLKRISGASIQDNKFIIIRGLNDRYNFVLINGVPLPSSETDRKAFSFDIFPSNMLDNVTVLKSGSPDLPGEFAGGVINVNTTEPKKVHNIQIGLSYNTITTFRPFYTYDGGKLDFLGLGANSRGLPNGLPSTLEFSELNKTDKAELAKLFNTSWSTESRMCLPSGNLQYSIGGIKNKFSYIFSYAYQNNLSYNTYIRSDFEEQATGVVKKMELKDSVFTQNILNTGMFNLTYKINDNNNYIKLKNIYSITSEDKVSIRNGVRELDNDPHQWEKSTNFYYTQNNLLTSQLNGSHKIYKSTINWNVGFSDINREVPNLRRIVYRKSSLLEDDTTVSYVAVVQTNGTMPNAAGNMFWSSSKERIYNLNYDYSVPFNFSTLENIIKIGGYHQYRDRIFTSRNLGLSQYKPTGSYFQSELLLLGPDDIFSNENMGLLNNGQGGFKLEESTKVDNNYSANSLLNSGFIMVDSKIKNIRISGGFRIESYNQNFNYIEFGSNLPRTIDTTVLDVLPSVNFVYSINKIKFRASYYKTVSRPDFRELAPFSFYNFIADNIISGNPNLKRATIDNIDLKFEMYPGRNQIISVSGFYKKFENPIEMINRTGTSGSPEIYYTNVDFARNIGMEFEFRYNMGNISKKDNFLDKLTAYANASIIKSSVDLNGFNGVGSERPLQYQSPYIINSGLLYKSDSSLVISLSYNIIGQRIYIVGNTQEPSVWENYRNVIDLQISKTFNKIEVKVNVKDLLAQDLVYFQDLNGNRKFDSGDNKWQEIKFGQNISISFKYNF